MEKNLVLGVNVSSHHKYSSTNCDLVILPNKIANIENIALNCEVFQHGLTNLFKTPTFSMHVMPLTLLQL